MDSDKLRVLVIDDMAIYRKVISDLLSELPGVEVVGTAPNGKLGLERCQQLQPDLITVDLEMPEVDGLEVLRRLQERHSRTGAIMLSAFNSRGADATVTALRLGAFDFVVKPSTQNATESLAALRKDLFPKIEAFTRARRIPRPVVATAPPAAAPAPVANKALRRYVSPTIVVIGVSTGGPQALATVLPKLPEHLAAPILIVQHMPPLFTRSLASDLNDKCKLAVREGADGELVQTGEVIFAPGGRQMKIERVAGEPRIRITDDPPENSCRPAVDYLFRSVVQTHGARALAVILTGMGSDGTAGCRLLKAAGAAVITQDEETSVVYGMPKGPAEEGLSDLVLPLDAIAPEIDRLVGRRTPACQ